MIYTIPGRDVLTGGSTSSTTTQSATALTRAGSGRNTPSIGRNIRRSVVGPIRPVGAPSRPIGVPSAPGGRGNEKEEEEQRMMTPQPYVPGRQSNADQDGSGVGVRPQTPGMMRPTYGERIKDPEERRRAYEQGQRGFRPSEGFRFGPLQNLASEMARRRGRRMNPALSNVM